MTKPTLIAAFGLMALPTMTKAKGPFFAAKCDGGE
jgi:hypothetical protein